MDRLRTSLLSGSALLMLVASGCANRPPVLNCVAESSTVTEGSSVTINSNAQDPDKKDVLTYNWTADRGRITSRNGTAVFDATGLTPGSYRVNLEVRDKKQNLASCAVDLNVRKNAQAPMVSCDPSSANITEGQSRMLSASASDPNGDALTYRWSVDGQSVPNDQASFEFGTSGRSVGEHRVTVTVTDVDGMSADCDFNVNITRRPNRDPSVSLSLDKSDVYAGETINAQARANDPDNDPLSYSWSLDNQSRPGGAVQLAINTSGLAGGRHSASVTVRDDRGGSASAAQSFSVREKIVIQMSGARVDNIGKAKLDEVALKMQQNPQLRATATGHTDDRGSEAGNRRMGQRRADAVKDYLVRQHNLEAGRIETTSAGESRPMADNSTLQGRRENRRVELELFVP